VLEAVGEYGSLLIHQARAGPDIFGLAESPNHESASVDFSRVSGL
jgi:hypothetical protein